MPPSALAHSRPLALAYSVLIYAAMLGLASLLVRSGKPRDLTRNATARVGAIDGLRGVLALGVLVHHSVISYVWATTGTWTAEDLNSIVVELGRSSVAVFFMITGFLFTRKTMRPIHWIGFFRDRLARVGPLYFVVVAAVVAIVLASTGGALREPFAVVVQEIVDWLAFVVFGRPDINGYRETSVIIASVNWSLKYEALFYVFWVPVLAVIDRFLKPAIALGSTVFLLAAVILFQRLTGHVYFVDMVFYEHFLGGIAVAYAYETPVARRVIQATWFRWVAAACAVALLLTPDPNTAKAVLLASIVFAAVAGGASIFGLLRTRSAIWLGEISYGIYLLHGLALWTAYRTVGAPASLLGFVAVVLTVGVVTVLAATASYLRLEMPLMARAKGRRLDAIPAAG